VASTTLNLFAITAPGLENLAATELHRLGIDGKPEPGGVTWSGDFESVARANLNLRTASRVIARVSEFRARSFIELERHIRRIDWSPFLAAGTPVQLRVSSKKSRLYHERAIAERFTREIQAALGVAVETAPAESEEVESEAPAGQLLIIRFHRDECTVSADSSGELLHRRGYRQALARAPLRETLAAAMLEASGWSPEAPLLDPFCGAGTIPIEAALIARRIPPGLAGAERRPREYAFKRWPTYEPATFDRVVENARAEIRDTAPASIRGSDRDEGAIEAAHANAERAGVAADIELEVRPLSGAAPSETPGWIVTNPPYGVRVGDTRPLRDLYAALGNVVRDRLPGWRLAMLSAEDALERQTKLDLAEVIRTKNGGIPVRVMVG
jgi:putative N6-adenine-specific DNA methylase